MPSGPPPILLAFSEVLPDLLDKWLPRTLGIITIGWSVMQSQMMLVPLAILFHWLRGLFRREQSVTTVFVGSLTHMLGDVLDSRFAGSDDCQLSYLAWPVFGNPHHQAAGYHPLWSVDDGPYVYLETALGMLAIGLWVFHGLPAVRFIRGVR